MKRTIPIKQVKNMIYYEMRKRQSLHDVLFDLGAYANDQNWQV